MDYEIGTEKVPTRVDGYAGDKGRGEAREGEAVECLGAAAGARMLKSRATVAAIWLERTHKLI